MLTWICEAIFSQTRGTAWKKVGSTSTSVSRRLSDFLADMRNHIGDQHQAQAHRALDQMRKRQMRDDRGARRFSSGKALQIGVDHADHQVAVGDHRRLRRAGGAGRVDEDRDVCRA